MKKISAALLFSAIIITGLFAQDNGPWFIGKPMVGFQFVGLQSVSENELLGLLDSYKNQPFSYDLYEEMQNKLLSLEYFESVSADAVPGDEGKTTVIVSFKLKERPIVSRIFFDGRASLSDNDLRGVILTKEQAVFSEAKIRLDTDAMRDLYVIKGFLDATVTYNFAPVPNTNLMEVRFVIEEGPKVSVKQILFSGNQFASEGTLKGLLKSKEMAFLVNSDFIESNLREDASSIENYYGQHGYYFAKVDKIDKQFEISEAERRKYIILTFYISEGAQYTYGGITFQGNRVFSTEKLTSLIRQKPGDILDKVKYREDYMRVIDIYYDNGYVTTQITPREKVDEGKKEISFEISFAEGDRSHIGRIIIQGNTKTKESVIRRELPFEEGEVFSKIKLQRGYINLMRTGFFSRNIQFEPVQGAEPNIIDVIITVEETRTAQLEVGGTVTPGDFPFSAYANLQDSNFLGDGVTTSLNLQLMPLVQSLTAYYQNNWLLGDRIIGGISLSFKHEIVQNVPIDEVGPFFNGDEEFAYPDGFVSWDDYQNALQSGAGIPPEYTMEYHSLQFSLGLVGGYAIDTLAGLLQFKAEPSVSLSYITYDPTVDRPFSNLLRDELNQWLFINRLGLTVSLTATDVPHNPESGYFLSQYIGFTGDFLFGERHYTRLQTEAEGYLKLFDIPVGDTGSFRMILALHSALNFVLPPLFGINPMKAVEEDYYRIDGMWVGRGWMLRQRGKVLWDNKLELRMPLVEDTLWWTVFFFDAAGLWQEPVDFLAPGKAIQNFYFSLGTGLRLTVPGIPLRIYFAKRFKWEDDNPYPTWQPGALTLWPGFDFDFVFAIDINPF